MDGNIPNTPPIIFVPQAGGPAALGRHRRRRWRGKARSTTARRPPAAISTTGSPRRRPKRSRQLVPTDGCVCTLPLSEGQGKSRQVHRRRQVAARSTSRRATTGPHGQGRRRRRSPIKPGDSRSRSPTPATSTKISRFTVGAWVKITQAAAPTGAIARPHGQRHSTFAAGTCGCENDRVGMHIINAWPDDALKVVARTPLQPNQWYHVCVDLRRLRQGQPASRSTSTASLQPVDVFTDKLHNTIRTKVPLKIGQRHAGERAARTSSLQDVRIYGRALVDARSRASSARSPQAAELLAKPADKRTPQENERTVRLVARYASISRHRELNGRSRQARSRKKSRLKLARHASRTS